MKERLKSYWRVLEESIYHWQERVGNYNWSQMWNLVFFGLFSSMHAFYGTQNIIPKIGNISRSTVAGKGSTN